MKEERVQACAELQLVRMVGSPLHSESIDFRPCPFWFAAGCAGEAAPERVRACTFGSGFSGMERLTATPLGTDSARHVRANSPPRYPLAP
jgi:hypothetical protein